MSKRKPVIAVDVDLTLVDTGIEWLEWLQRKYTCKDLVNFIDKCEASEIPYNLSTEFNVDHGDPFDFWKQGDLYDNLTCYESSKIVLEHLYKKGWEIVFISWCFDHGQHAESKANMLRREFSFIDKEDFHFCQTKSKGIFSKSFDYFIEDRHSFINSMKKSVTCFKINTPYTQDEELTRECFVVDSWDEIINILEV